MIEFLVLSHEKMKPPKSILFSWFIVPVLVSALFLVVESDLSSDREALLTLRRSVKGRPLLWNISEPSPCSWPGVTCVGGRVSELRLPGMGLSGSLPLALGNLSELQTLSLRLNSLSGSLPSDWANLQSLQYLYLQGNSFSGEIPNFLLTLKSLVRLVMAQNKFSGEIPAGFSNLPSLTTLYLEDNEFTGSIPELPNPNLVQFNVSFNRLNGKIPSKFSTLSASAFEGNSLCGMPLKSCNGKKKLSGGAIAGIVIGCLIFILIVVILLFLCRRKKGEKSTSKELTSSAISTAEAELPREKNVGSSDSMSSDFSGIDKRKVKGGGGKSLIFFGNVPKEFDLEDLLRASAEVLGKGSSGTTYKAIFETGTAVAVRRLKDVSASEKEFREKIEEIGRINHENLVHLKAYYYSKDEKLLVYDYIPMGSLSALLHGSKEVGRSPLSWEARIKIALGASRAIRHLHLQGQNISHGNIKSSNVLLDASYAPRVSDFGLAQLISPASAPNRVAGYRAPEVTDPRKISQKADVYSFGVLLLELLTGKAPTYSLSNEEGVDLPRWVQSVVQEEWTAEVFDVELLRYQNVEEEMVQLLQIGLLCAAPHPDNRPSMVEVTSRIEELCGATLRKEQEAGDNNAYDVNIGVSP